MAALEKQKNIVLGVTGGIAAYKSAELVRLLTKAGYRVFPVLTEWGARFIGPLTLEALSGNKVRIETPAQGEPEGIEHISLIRAAALLVVAPLTANTMAKMANGLADNFLTATYLAHRGEVLACPAMNTAMLQHPATQRNLSLLEQDGVRLLYGDAGDLACGETGAGRMVEPTVIFEEIEAMLSPIRGLTPGLKVLVSAGPTREDLDPVRFLSNRSTGKMGLAVARAFRHAGAAVTLVHGPINETPSTGVTLVPVRTAAEMADAVLSRRHEMNVIVMTAAVADYKPVRHEHKLKKDDFDGGLQLVRTRDILAALGEQKPARQILVGFAAESREVEANAAKKLKKKNLDLICANNIAAPGEGFAGDQNRLLLLDREGNTTDLGTQSKFELACEIVRRIAELAKA